jgi:hypothetical protein
MIHELGHAFALRNFFASCAKQRGPPKCSGRTIASRS